MFFTFSPKTIRRRNLYFTVFAVNLMYLTAGETVTWTSPTILKIIIPNPVIQIPREQSGLITICTASGQILGPFLSGFLIGKIGRKGTIYTALCMYTLHWIVVLLAINIETILAARVLTGAAVGITMSCVPLYIAEIAEDNIRGVLNSFTMTSRSVGYLICYSIGPFVPYRVLVLICMALPLALFAILFPIPESPYYLVLKGRTKDAQKNLSWLRRKSSEEVKDEIDMIQTSVHNAKAEKIHGLEFFHSPVNVRALKLCGVIRFAQEINGITVFINIMQLIIVTSNVPVSSTVGCIVVGATFLISSLFGPTVVSLYGYKKPLVVSYMGIVIALLVLGSHFYLMDQNYAYEWLALVPIACLTVHCVLYAGGVNNTAFALVGEMFAPRAKRFGTTASNFIGFLTSNFTVIFYNVFKGIAGTHTIIWSFAGLTFLGTLFTIIFLPETSHMSLEEIQTCLSKPFVKIKKPNVYVINTVLHI